MTNTSLVRRLLTSAFRARPGSPVRKPRLPNRPLGGRIEVLEDRATPAVALLGTSTTVLEDTGAATSATIPSYSVPAGTNRLLVVSTGAAGSSSVVSTVTFNGTTLTPGEAFNNTTDGS